MINKPLQVAEFLNENCHFLDVEEIFENSIEDKRIIERISEDCQEASIKTFTPSHLDTDFHEELKGSCLPNCDEEFPMHRGSTLPQNLHHHFSEEEVSFLSFFDFKYPDLTDAELTSLCQILIKDKDVYSTCKYDVGCTKQNFHISLKDDAFFKPQRVTKVPVHYREQVNALLERLIQVGIIREINNDDELGTFLDNPITYLRKEKNLKLCVDSRFLNSITKLVSIPFTIEPIQILLTRLTGKVFSVSDLSNAYHQVPLTEESQKCTAFVIGNKQYTYCCGFYGLSGLPNFFSRLMALSMAPLIKTNQALTYIDDTILQAQNKAEMFEIIPKHHALVRTAGLKVSPEKNNFLFTKSKIFRTHSLEQGDKTYCQKSPRFKKTENP